MPHEAYTFIVIKDVHYDEESLRSPSTISTLRHAEDARDGAGAGGRDFAERVAERFRHEPSTPLP
jgi:hypothetical protein